MCKGRFDTKTLLFIYGCLDKAHWYSGLKLFFWANNTLQENQKKVYQSSYNCSVILSIIQYESEKQVKAWGLKAATAPEQMTFKCKNFRSRTSRWEFCQVLQYTTLVKQFSQITC